MRKKYRMAKLILAYMAALMGVAVLAGTFKVTWFVENSNFLFLFVSLIFMRWLSDDEYQRA